MTRELYRLIVIWPATATSQRHEYQKGEPAARRVIERRAAKYAAEGAGTRIEHVPPQHVEAAKAAAIDARVENHGSLALIRPLTKAAKVWFGRNLPEDAQYMGDAPAIEPRYVSDIVDGMIADGLVVA